MRSVVLICCGAGILLSGLFGADVGDVPIRGSFLTNTQDEVQYWRNLHAREAEAKANAERKFNEFKAAPANSPDAIIEAARSADILPVEPPPPVVEQEPVFDWAAHKEKICFGAALALTAIVTLVTLARHRREALARQLSGKYLCDGLEAAYLKYPELFREEKPAPTAPAVAPEATTAEPTTKPKTLKVDPLEQFYTEVPVEIATLRATVPEIEKAAEEAARAKQLGDLHEKVTALKERAKFWDVKPFWQMTSVLQPLLKRLSEKPKDATPSTLRTVANAFDLLAELSKPGIRPNLVIAPPVEVLAVDDDTLCRKAVSFALEKAALKPDTAENGEIALKMATEKAYDVILMDVQMPEMDGLTCCGKIRETEKNRNTPLVFVTVQSDFQTRAQSIELGGTDLMAKPFLIFEITVKTLTFAMRKRMQADAEAGPVIATAEASPGGKASEAELKVSKAA